MVKNSYWRIILDLLNIMPASARLVSPSSHSPSRSIHHKIQMLHKNEDDDEDLKEYLRSLSKKLSKPKDAIEGGAKILQPSNRNYLKPTVHRDLVSDSSVGSEHDKFLKPQPREYKKPEISSMKVNASGTKQPIQNFSKRLSDIGAVFQAKTDLAIIETNIDEISFSDEFESKSISEHIDSNGSQYSSDFDSEESFVEDRPLDPKIQILKPPDIVQSVDTPIPKLPVERKIAHVETQTIHEQNIAEKHTQMDTAICSVCESGKEVEKQSKIIEIVHERSHEKHDSRDRDHPKRSKIEVSNQHSQTIEVREQNVRKPQVEAVHEQSHEQIHEQKPSAKLDTKEHINYRYRVQGEDGLPAFEGENFETIDSFIHSHIKTLSDFVKMNRTMAETFKGTRVKDETLLLTRGRKSKRS